MDTTITADPAGKRTRNGSVILTNRLCERRVPKRVKLYDRKCPGLYVSITTAGVATFSIKFTDPETGKQRTGWLGVYNPETFTVDDARSKVYGLKGLGGDAIAETFRDRRERQAKRGKTVDEIIEERIDWMKMPVRKADGEMRPRLESWENTEAICAVSSARSWAGRSRPTSPEATFRLCRTTSWRVGTVASRLSAMRVTCARRHRACSGGHCGASTSPPTLAVI